MLQWPYAWTGVAMAPILLAGCGEASKAESPVADVAAGAAQPVSYTSPLAKAGSAEVTTPVVGPVPQALTLNVTKAGFPFKRGIYTSKSCDRNSGGLVEFMGEGLHYWEADQATRFEKILKLDAGRYRITELFNSDEGGDTPEDVEYQTVGPKSFRRTEHFSWDEKTGKKIKRDSSETFSYCRPIERSDG